MPLEKFLPLFRRVGKRRRSGKLPRFRLFCGGALSGIVFLMILLLLPQESADLAGIVVGVADGDTLTVLTPTEERVRVRLAELDAPEKAQPYGQRAKQSLSDLCYQKPARVNVHEQDRYGRSVGRVYCDGVDANAQQVRRGLAWVYDAYAAPESDLYALQDAAKTAKTGLWADPNPIRPWEWRKKAKAAKS
jgi:endonuclease YncB( thermonuclease family)